LCIVWNPNPTEKEKGKKNESLFAVLNPPHRVPQTQALHTTLHAFNSTQKRTGQMKRKKTYGAPLNIRCTMLENVLLFLERL
jgi:hypothetical protein